MPSHPWLCKYWTSVWVQRWDPGWTLLYGPDPMRSVDLWLMSSLLRQQVPFPFLCGCIFVPSVWVENESTFGGLVSGYSWMLREGAHRERTKLRRLLGVFWIERHYFLQVIWCQDSSECWWCIYHRRKIEWRCRREAGICIPKFLRYLDSTCGIWYISKM